VWRTMMRVCKAGEEEEEEEEEEPSLEEGSGLL
jgi:hypothetical protein